MTVVRHADVAAFQAAAHDFLMADEAEHNLLLGIVDGLLADRDVTPDGSKSGEPLLFVTVGSQLVELAAIRTPPHKLVLSRLPRKGGKRETRQCRVNCSFCQQDN